MLKNEKVDRENKKLSRDMRKMFLEEVFYDIRDYESKPLQIKTCIFPPIFLGLHELQFSKKTYLKQHYRYLIFFIKLNYLVEINIL